jgi:hypothetical protein
MTGATSGAGTAYPSRPPYFTLGFQWGPRHSFLALCVCFVDLYVSYFILVIV